MVAVEHRGGAEHLRHRHDAGAADPGDPHRELVVGHDARGLGQIDGRLGQLRRAPRPSLRARARVGSARFFGVTVMNDGQSPSRHEKSRLQVV